LPTPSSDGSLSCGNQQRQEFQGGQGANQSSTTPSRPNSVANPTENANIGAQDTQRTSQQRRTLPPEPLTEFQKFVAATTGQILPVYGANLFRNVPTTFAPSNLTPVTSDYVVGPDDELRIRIWGQINYSGNLRVDRSGDIYLPEAGAVHVAGLEASALDQHLRSAVGRVYRNFDLSVDLGRIRAMQVYVTGQARRPGAYTVSSLSSLVDALFASGGPSTQGSLRHIELRRGGKNVADFDLYALLIHGDKSNDLRLLPEDVLYIQPAGPQVAITGSIHNPAIYELRGKETIGDLIDAAGKTTAIAASTRVSLERVGERQIREAMEFAFDPTGLAAPLADGDIVRVYAIVPAYQKTVTLRGDVANPGRFAWRQGMHVTDLIPDRDSLLSRDYWWRRSHLGLPAPEFEPFISNPYAAQEKLQRNNAYLYNQNPNSLNGTQTYPGEPSTNNPYANTSNGNGQNTVPQGSYNSNNYYNQDPTSPAAQDALTAALDASTTTDQDLANGSDRNASGSLNTTASEGTRGNTLASQMNSTNGAGGGQQTQRTDVHIAAPGIDWNYAVIERLDPDTLKTSLLPFDLGKLVMQHDTSQDLPLQAGDTITVFSQGDIRVPLAEQTKYVHLEGEFVHAGIYSVHPGETLRDLVRRAGGFTPQAYLYGSEFDRESTRKLQQERIDEYVRRVDLDSERGNLALAANPSSSAGTLASASAATAAEAQLIARLKQIRATGRIVLNFQIDSVSIDDVPPLTLENGDRFSIPPTPSTVNIVGAVYDQNSFLYHPGGSAGRYLLMAGGPDRNADFNRTFVIRADGSVVNRDSVKGLWGNEFKTFKLYPGDTIIVPDKTIRPTALRGLLDWTQVFAQLALGVAAVEVLK
jgi:protein involved in polysaccharide export with SLBB domain